MDYLPNVRTFASVDTFIEASGSLRLGRLVANATFLESLLRHSPYERFEFFCPSPAEARRLRDWTAALPDGNRLAARIDLRSQLELPARLREASWEVVHSGGWSRYMPALAWLRARYATRHVPLSGTIHSLNDPSMPEMLRRLLRAPLGQGDAVICTSVDGRESFRRQMERVAGGVPVAARLELAPLGVGEEYFRTRDKAAARARRDIGRDRPVALWIGRLTAAMKADLNPLLYQWRLLLAQGILRDPLLILAGGGVDGEVRALEATIRELGLGNHVRIRRDVEDDEKMDLLVAADVFVSPVDNQQETFGISVVEAMAAGLPVVASCWDGYKDLVEPGVTGVLVPVRWTAPPHDVVALRGILEPPVAQLSSSQGVAVDPVALRNAIAALLADPSLARSMGEAGRRRAAERFAWPKVIARLSSIWSDLASSAATLPIPGAGGASDPDILDPGDVFGHFAEPSPAGDPVVRVSELGEHVLAGRLPMPATFDELLPVSDGALLTALVVKLRGSSRNLSDHAGRCCAATGRPRDEGVWLAHWLLKYGLLEEAG